MSDTLFDFDPITKIESHVHEEEGKLTVASFQDVEDIIEANKRLYNSTDERARYTAEVFNHTAQIPLNIWFELWRTGVAQDEMSLRKWLDNPDNKYFRTRPGKLSR